MEGDRLSGGIAPLIFKLGSRHIWVVRLGWVGAGAGLDVLEKRSFSCFCQIWTPALQYIS